MNFRLFQLFFSVFISGITDSFSGLCVQLHTLISSGFTPAFSDFCKVADFYFLFSFYSGFLLIFSTVTGFGFNSVFVPIFLDICFIFCFSFNFRLNPLLFRFSVLGFVSFFCSDFFCSGFFCSGFFCSGFSTVCSLLSVSLYFSVF